MHTPESEPNADPSNAWKALLAQPGQYEHACETPEAFRQLRRLGFVWRRVLDLTGLRPGATIFELGCGGGRHLAALAANGFVTHGVDISPDVVARTEAYLASVRRHAPIRATVEIANFLEYSTEVHPHRYDMCFHAGVVEHFLDATQRAAIWRKLTSLTKPGGWIVSIVPAGRHILRPRMREERLMGYDVPEIDYDCALHAQEFHAAGLLDIRCVAHNFFAFLPIHHSRVLRGPLARPLFLLGNATLPWMPLPERWKERFASTLIALGRKPLEDRAR